MSDHTREPWEASRRNWRDEPDLHRIYISGDFRQVGDEDDEDDPPATVATAVAIVEGNATSGSVTKANARRIIACVNATRDISTADLEAVARHGTAEARVNALARVPGQTREVTP